MGGNALAIKGITPERMDNTQRTDISKTLYHELFLLGCASVLLPTPYTQKTSHGDLDIIVAIIDVNLIRRWLDKNNYTYVTNNNCISFHYKSHQVDIIHFDNVEKAWLQYAYMNNGDAGNLIGKLYKSYSFKFSHEGLFYCVRKAHVYPDEPDRSVRRQIIQEIFITNNIKNIITALNIPYDNWNAGFESLESCSNWVAQSQFFDPKFFQDDNDDTNHADRTRMRKRNSYQFIQHMPIKSTNHTEDKKQLINNLIDYDILMNTVDTSIRNYKRQIEQLQLVKQVFNGTVCAAAWNLSGKQLGDAMKQFKASHNINANQDDVTRWINTFKPTV